MIDYKGIGRSFGVDDRTSKRLFAKAMDVVRKLVGDLPQSTIERDYSSELMQNFQDLLQMNRKYEGADMKGDKIKEQVNPTGVFHAVEDLNELLDVVTGEEFSIPEGTTFKVTKNSSRMYRINLSSGENYIVNSTVWEGDVEAFLVFEDMIRVSESTNKENEPMRNKTKIREYLEGDMDLDALINDYDLNEEESYSQSIINPNTVKRKEYADADGDLAGENGYGTSYAPEGENAYGTEDDKNEILKAETAFDNPEGQGADIDE